MTSIDRHALRAAAMAALTIALCEECGRDAANAIGFMCSRDGGWSKLELRKHKHSGASEKKV